MALPSSGVISLSQVNVELGKAATAAITMNDSAVRTLAGVSSGAISMSNLHGKSNIPFPTVSAKAASTHPYSTYRVLVTVTPSNATTSASWVSGGSYLQITKVN